MRNAAASGVRDDDNHDLQWEMARFLSRRTTGVVFWFGRTPIVPKLTEVTTSTAKARLLPTTSTELVRARTVSNFEKRDLPAVDQIAVRRRLEPTPQEKTQCRTLFNAFC